jgi:hypothetical protein
MLTNIAKSLILLLPAQIQYRIRSYRNKLFKNSIIKRWKMDGRPIPPPNQFKHCIVEYYQNTSNYGVLIETGTFLGDMIEAQRYNFREIYSIELSDKLWNNAKKRFAKYSHIKIFKGDSGAILKDVLLNINEPSVFWLDAHYDSGETAKGDTECPIFQELDAVFAGNKFNNIILIDDARSFTGSGDYPTIDELVRYVQNKDSRYKVIVEDDIIRFIIAQDH